MKPNPCSFRTFSLIIRSPFNSFQSFIPIFKSAIPIPHSFKSLPYPNPPNIQKDPKTPQKAVRPAIHENLQLCSPLNFLKISSPYKKAKPQTRTLLKLISLFKSNKKNFSELHESDAKILQEEEKALKLAMEEKRYQDFLNHAKAIYTLKQKCHGEKYENGHFEDLKNIGYGNFLMENYTESLFFYDESMKYAEKELDKTEVCLQMGQLYRVMNNEESALESLNEGYTHGKTLFSCYLPNFTDTIITIAYHVANISRNLIDIYKKRRNNVKQKELLSENIQIFMAFLRINNTRLNSVMVKDFLSHIYDCCEDLTTISLQEGNLDLAERTISNELEAVKYSNDPFFLSRGLFNKGLILSNAEKFDEAHVSFLKGREILLKFLEEKPKETYLDSFLKDYEVLMYMLYGGLANALLRLKMNEEGLKIMEEVEKFNESHPANDSFMYLHIMNKKAEFLLEDAKYEEAWKILVQVSTGIEKMDLTSIKNLMFRSYVLTLQSSVGGQLEKYDEALKAALENVPLLERMVQEFPEKKEIELANHYTLGALYGRMKKYKESKKEYDIALGGYKAMGNKPYDMDRIYTDLGHLAEQEGDTSRARQYFMNSLEIRKKLSQEVNEPLVDEVKEKIDELTPKKKKKK